MKIRIGINTGEMVTGNMGSKLHMNYTMIGEEVNLASRLESGSKLYGIYFHTTYKTLEYAGLDRYEWRYIDKVIFKGFTEWRQTVEIFGYKEKSNENTTKLIELFHKGLDYYYNREWDMAIHSFKYSLKYETFNHSNNLNPSNKKFRGAQEIQDLGFVIGIHIRDIKVSQLKFIAETLFSIDKI